MITPDLIKNIRSKLQAGQEPDDIKSELLSSGSWGERDVKEVFRILKPDFPDQFKDQAPKVEDVKTKKKSEQTIQSSEKQPPAPTKQSEQIKSAVLTKPAKPVSRPPVTKPRVDDIQPVRSSDRQKTYAFSRIEPKAMQIDKNFLRKKKIQGFFIGLLILVIFFGLIGLAIYLAGHYLNWF